MYVTICRTDDQCKFVHDVGHSKLVLWDNPEGVGGAGGRWEWGFWMGDTCTCG